MYFNFGIVILYNDQQVINYLLSDKTTQRSERQKRHNSHTQYVQKTEWANETKSMTKNKRFDLKWHVSSIDYELSMLCVVCTISALVDTTPRREERNRIKWKMNVSRWQTTTTGRTKRNEMQLQINIYDFQIIPMINFDSRTKK